MPPSSTRAIDPPPAPSVWMSIDGSASFEPAIIRSPESWGSPPSSSAMSVLVPPMSNVIRLPSPTSRAQ
jgi:hypothetical protein